MQNEQIQESLIARFSAPLPEFYRRRIIFWKDEEREFEQDAEEFSLSGVRFVKLTGTNNFAVKKLLLSEDTESSFLVYCPLSYAEVQDDWLLDIELYSEVFRADLVSMRMEELHIEPSVLMRKTVKLYAKFFESRERRQRLLRMGQEYRTPLQLHTDIMAVLCGLSSGNAQDIIMAVLTAGLSKEENPLLLKIGRFGSLEAFWQLVRKYTGYIEEAEKSLWELAAHIFLTALSQTMPASALRGLERFLSGSEKAYCYSLVHEWLGQAGDGIKEEPCSGCLEETGGSPAKAGILSLYDLCRTVEEVLKLSARFDRLEIETLLSGDIFPAINESLLKRLYGEIAEHNARTAQIEAVCENRRTAGWYKRFSAQFSALSAIGKMQAFYETHTDCFHLAQAQEVWKAYTEDFYRMDTYYRQFHLAFGNALTSSEEVLEDGLKHAAEYVEALYQDWFLRELNAAWIKTAEENFRALGYVSEIPKQRDFFQHFVSTLSAKKTRAFVIISDALRYEAAEELCRRLMRSGRGNASLSAVQAVFPSVTRFGMAALLPGKELSVTADLEVLVDGLRNRSTAEREHILCKASAGAAVQYTELLRMKQAERRAFVSGKDVVYIYHNTIDAIGDKLPTEQKVFEACETAIEELLNIVRIVTNELGGTNLLITADHGFLYTARPLSESEKLDRSCFSGSVLELGRRYALCEADTTAENLLSVNLSSQYGGVSLWGYAPRDAIRMKVQGGGENYVHGGISLEELCVPVISFKSLRGENKKYAAAKSAELSLLSESRKLSNLIFSLDFYQKEPVGDKVEPCTYQLYFADEEGTLISDRKTVIADRREESASERVFRLQFHLKPGVYDRKKSYRLIIAGDTERSETEFCIDIAFADDFGFDL